MWTPARRSAFRARRPSSCRAPPRSTRCRIRSITISSGPWSMASRNRALRWILVILRLALGAIFIYAAWVKLRLPWQLFAMSIDSYQLLPPGPVEFLARTLPAFELLLGVALIAGKFLRFTSAITSALLLV